MWSDAQREAAREAEALVREPGLDTVRLSFADQHGVLRGKSVPVAGLGDVFRNGCTITTTLLAKDTAHRTVFPVWQAGGGFGLDEMTGGGDVVMVPDPTTFRILPWLERTGWVLCDLYFQDGTPVPFSTRQIAREALARLGEQGYDLVTGLEIEFHVLELVDPKLDPAHATQPGVPPETRLLAQGFQYLTENRLDELEPVLSIVQAHLTEMGLPLRSVEAEFGPSQVELTFRPQAGLRTADDAVLLRAAVKQICRRHGYHATFMCRPNVPNLFSSGWHLHQSLATKDGKNAFTPESADDALSLLGQHWLAGLLANVPAACALTTPTINGYKRYRPFVLAPDRVAWGRDNRGTMLRVVGGAGDPGTRIENRVGESAANPYLYLVSQVVSGLEGVSAGTDPPPPVDEPYDTPAESLPRSLIEAVAAFRASETFRDALGERFVDYFATIKEAEIARFLSEVTDWEQREYFSLF